MIIGAKESFPRYPYEISTVESLEKISQNYKKGANSIFCVTETKAEGYYPLNTAICIFSKTIFLWHIVKFYKYISTYIHNVKDNHMSTWNIWYFIISGIPR